MAIEKSEKDTGGSQRALYAMYHGQMMEGLVNRPDILDAAVQLVQEGRERTDVRQWKHSWLYAAEVLQEWCIEEGICSPDTSVENLRSAISAACTGVIGGALLELERPELRQSVLRRIAEHAPHEVPPRKLKESFESVGLEWLLETPHLRRRVFEVLHQRIMQEESAATAATTRRRGR